MKRQKSFILLFVTTAFLLSACAMGRLKPMEGEPVLYPAPPERTRVQYLLSVSNSVDVEGRHFTDILTGNDQGKPIIKPYGVSLRKGKLYIADTILAGLEIVDLEGKNFQYFQPKGEGRLKKPINCVKDADGKLYVADAGRAQIVVFDENDVYLDAFGLEHLEKPTDVYVTEDRIYVTDIKHQSVEVFSKEDYRFLQRLPDPALSKDEHLFSPTNVAVRGDRVYVSDFGDFKIKVYTRSGDFIRAIGSYGRNIGQFVRPKGIAVDKELNLYVVDAGFENVQIFNKDGRLLMFFGGSYKEPGDMWLPAKVAVSYDPDDLKYFRRFVDDAFDLAYLIVVSNQYGPDKINIYGAVIPKNGAD